MTDIFTEVEEDLRREKAKRLWDRYGWIATTLVVAIVLGTGAFQGWRWYQAREAAAAAERFLAATRAAEANNTEAALADLAPLAQSGPGGYRLLARLQEAGLRARAGEREAAIRLWEGIAADSSTPAPYRDLALLLSVLHSIDGGDPAALTARLMPLDRPDGAFRYSARELLAAIAMKQGERDRAITILRALAAAEDAPTALRNRAAETLGALGSPAQAGS